ncbi:peptide chain release factor N(5)-glutamine methyltransferase [soil metagenome]
MGETKYTVLEILKLTADHFSRKNIPEARLNAEMLLCYVLNCNRMKLYLDFDKPLQMSEINAYRELVRRRQIHEPVQYIIGKASFYKSDFVVNKNVLIPRAETEILVEEFLKEVKGTEKQLNILEIGTGSGCISISIAKELNAARMKFSIQSTDISEDALKVARENETAILGESIIDFKSEDIFSLSKIEEKFEYVISNPPYISKQEHSDLEKNVKDFEPEIALTDNEDGMKFYKKIIELSKGTGRKIFFEIAYNAKDKLESLLKAESISGYKFVKDHSGNYRVLIIKL